MSNEGQCFRCRKQIETGDGMEVWGSKVGEDLTRVRVHKKCNTSFAGRCTYFFGPGHEERRAFGELTEAARAEREEVRLGARR